MEKDENGNLRGMIVVKMITVDKVETSKSTVSPCIWRFNYSGETLLNMKLTKHETQRLCKMAESVMAQVPILTPESHA